MPRPVPNAVYTAREVYSLDLLDTPNLQFRHGGHLTVIQTAHLMDAELLSVPGFADTRWRYQRTTHEWIPLFMAVDDSAVHACVDIEPDRSPFSSDEDAFWVTPKGFPREQYVYAL